MRVIQVTVNNVFKLTTVCSKWLAETKCAMPVDSSSGSKQIMEWINQGPDEVGIFAIVDDEVEGNPYVGFIACHTHSYPFVRCTVVSEYGWFVSKEYRGNGGLLLKAMERWGKERGAEIMVSNIYLGAGADNGERACQALKNAGFTEFERAFFRKI